MAADRIPLDSSDLATVIALARQAGALVRAQAGRSERLTKRNGAEAVTEADRASQRLIVAGLRQHWPDDGIIGEESDTGEGITNVPPRNGERVWVIDPIDGTNNFVAGLGCYAVCIGLLTRGMPTLGVVYDVARDQCYAAGPGTGAMLDGHPVTIATGGLSDRTLVMLTSNLLGADGHLMPCVRSWFEQAPWKVRMLGSAALEAVQVAAGTAHAAVTVNGKLWDVVAPAAICLEAGARLTAFDGSPVFPFVTADYAGLKVPFVVGNPAAHAELVRDLGQST